MTMLDVQIFGGGEAIRVTCPVCGDWDSALVEQAAPMIRRMIHQHAAVTLERGPIRRCTALADRFCARPLQADGTCATCGGATKVDQNRDATIENRR